MLNESGLEKQLKSSQFNEYLGKLDPNWVVYNNLSGGMIEVGRELYEILSANNASLLTEKLVEVLKHGKFIVDADLDEAEQLRETKQKWDEDVKVIGLQLVPTLSCNFACPYCYENQGKKTKRMSKDVMDKIIGYVENKIKPTTENINVSWYGGEPLIAIKQIEYISNGLFDVIRGRKIAYSASMVTNGYLLKKINVDTLLKCHIRGIQVTIDGPKEIHDQRRCLVNGNGTWKRIVDNLKYALSKDILVTIRVNIDKTNINSIEQLFKELHEENIFSKVNISFGAVSRFGNACKSIEDNILNLEEAEKVIGNENIQSKLKSSKKSSSRIHPNYIGCVAVAKNSLIIGPGGELYKCSKTIGSMGEICGHISKPDFTHPNFQKWIGIDNLAIPSCEKCSVLPLCKGYGCAFDLIVKGEDIFNCPSQKFKKDYAKRMKELYLVKSGFINKI